MREEREIEYPCDDCKDEPKCVHQNKYKICLKWLSWFGQQWRRIQKIFDVNVSERHNEKEGDDK